MISIVCLCVCVRVCVPRAHVFSSDDTLNESFFCPSLPGKSVLFQVDLKRILRELDLTIGPASPGDPG